MPRIPPRQGPVENLRIGAGQEFPRARIVGIVPCGQLRASIVNPLKLLRRLGPLAAAAMLLVTTAAPAAAHSATDGPDHQFGEMVDYPLVDPVAGDYRMSDTFYAGRSDGVHHAQDLMAPKMTPVVAVATGVVQRVNWSSNANYLNESRCCTIVLIHKDGWESWYIHLNNDTPGTDDGQGWGIAPGILPGTRVTAGDLIGWVGDSGNAESTAPHLHYELRDPHGTVVNPYQALQRASGVTITGGGGGGGGSTCTAIGETSALLNGTTALRRGSTGTAVAQLQSVLAALGYTPGSADGSMGPKTEGALRGFQDDRGITVDGVAGGQTRSAISTIVAAASHASVLYPGAPLRPGDRGQAVTNLQQLLRVAGFSPGTADGAYGPLTTAAVTALQEAEGLTVDGKVGPQTRTALSRILGLEGLAAACG